MAKKKTEEKAPVAPEVPEVVINIETEKPKTFNITLEGARGQFLEGGVNGTMFKLPKGVEITVGEPIYNAVKAYIVQEREE